MRFRSPGAAHRECARARNRVERRGRLYAAHDIGEPAARGRRVAGPKAPASSRFRQQVVPSDGRAPRSIAVLRATCLPSRVIRRRALASGREWCCASAAASPRTNAAAWYGMSYAGSRSGGSGNSPTLSRRTDRPRNRPAATSARRSAVVAATTATSDAFGLERAAALHLAVSSARSHPPTRLA